MRGEGSRPGRRKEQLPAQLSPAQLSPAQPSLPRALAHTPGGATSEGSQLSKVSLSLSKFLSFLSAKSNRAALRMCQSPALQGFCGNGEQLLGSLGREQSQTASELKAGRGANAAFPGDREAATRGERKSDPIRSQPEEGKREDNEPKGKTDPAPEASSPALPPLTQSSTPGCPRRNSSMWEQQPLSTATALYRFLKPRQTLGKKPLNNSPGFLLLLGALRTW